MSSVTSLLVVVACAALLQVGCEARQNHNYHQQRHPSRRNIGDASVALGTIQGSNIISLPQINLSGPDVIIGFPDNCAGKGLILLGTAVVVSSVYQGVPPDLVPDDADDPLSNVAIHCNWDLPYPGRCVKGVSVASFQYCSAPLPPTTTSPLPTTSPSTTTTPSSTTPSSTTISASSSSSSEE